MKTIVFSYDAEMVPFYYSGMMNAAVPEGTPPLRISDKKIKKNSLPAVTRRGHEAGVHRIQAIFTIGYPAAVWDVTVSDNGEFIAAAVDLA